MGLGRIGIVVPAHNEESLLPGCLEAIAAAVHEVAPVPADIIVVADACTDATAELAAAAGAVVVAVRLRSVGEARRAGVARAREGGAEWIASTDADSQVPVDWLSAQARLAAAGADVVVGTVAVSGWSEWPVMLPPLYEHRYAVPDAAGQHGHVHGANLGFSLTGYDRAGGFAPVAVDEDVALVAGARAAGLTVTCTSDIPVRTSARRRARVRGGFASYLADLERQLS